METNVTTRNLQSDTAGPQRFQWTAAEYHERKALVALMRVKDADIRISILEQARDAVDKGVHIGGAFSAVIPLVSLYYGGAISNCVEDPTSLEQDVFILSKGHAVAAAAAIYADMGYFDRALLKNSRGFESILNGHPGPILPGFHISTGPMGQGLSVASGVAMAGKDIHGFDTFTMTGDGELQEGNIWEGVMYAGAHHLDNFCVIVDHNHGQLDNPRSLHYTPVSIAAQFESFGWRAVTVDGTQYETVLEALHKFKYGTRDGRPTVIVSVTRKGYGGFSDLMVGHKITMSEAVAELEISLHRAERAAQAAAYRRIVSGLSAGSGAVEWLSSFARRMNLDPAGGVKTGLAPVLTSVKTRRAPVRDKKIRYNEAELPQLDTAKQYMCSEVITMAMRVMSIDPRVVTVDSDLSSTSGLQPGVALVDRRRAKNVGIAEANMMCVGEGYASLGYNTWVSTFCPFFNLNVMRRIAISQQERLESIRHKNGWLSEGHGLDLTFLATAANFDTRTNGATHMGNDDHLIMDEVGHLRVIDVSCPNQMLAVMKWIMEGNRGLVYVRIMRSGSKILYSRVPEFTFGKGYILRDLNQPAAVLVSAGRQVHESLSTAELLETRGIAASVVDMPSFDPVLLLDVISSGALLVLAEQNNGYLLRKLQKAAYQAGMALDPGRILAVNTLGKDGNPEYVHSAEYDELTAHYGLAPEQLARRVAARLSE